MNNHIVKLIVTFLCDKCIVYLSITLKTSVTGINYVFHSYDLFSECTSGFHLQGLVSEGTGPMHKGSRIKTIFARALFMSYIHAGC